MILSNDDIERTASQPSILPPAASADDYQMERYRWVAREAAAAFAEERCMCPNAGPCPGHVSCRRCWREALKREGR